MWYGYCKKCSIFTTPFLRRFLSLRLTEKEWPRIWAVWDRRACQSGSLWVSLFHRSFALTCDICIGSRCRCGKGSGGQHRPPVTLRRTERLQSTETATIDGNDHTTESIIPRVGYLYPLLTTAQVSASYPHLPISHWAIQSSEVVWLWLEKKITKKVHWPQPWSNFSPTFFTILNPSTVRTKQYLMFDGIMLGIGAKIPVQNCTHTVKILPNSHLLMESRIRRPT